jgi:hypothetical protein
MISNHKCPEEWDWSDTGGLSTICAYRYELTEPDIWANAPALATHYGVNSKCYYYVIASKVWICETNNGVGGKSAHRLADLKGPGFLKRPPVEHYQAEPVYGPNKGSPLELNKEFDADRLASLMMGLPADAAEDWKASAEEDEAFDALEQRQYSKYFRDVSRLDSIDVYEVHRLFTVEDHALCHASKKILLAGMRTGGKTMEEDIREARDTLTRWLEMEREL